MLSEAYCSKDLAALNDYLNNLSGPSELRDTEFFLRNLTQLAKNKSHLAEWACTYLIAKERLGTTTENIQNYPFIIRILSRINGWERQSLLEKLTSVCNEEVVDKRLLRNLIVSFLHKISQNGNISILGLLTSLPKSKKSGANRDGVSAKVDEIEKIVISFSVERSLIISDPIKITQEKESPYYISSLIESFLSYFGKSKNKTQQNIKKLYLLNEGNNIAMIEISISGADKKIVIQDFNFILKREVIKEVKSMVKKYHCLSLVILYNSQLGVSQLENYYYIRDYINQFLLGTTVEITRLDDRHSEEACLDEIKNNLDLKDQYNNDYLLALFKVAIPWNAKEFVEWKDVFLKSKETPSFNKNSLKIAQQVSESMLYIPDSVQSKCAKECVSISDLDVNIILLRFYCNLLNEIKNAQLADKSNKITIHRFFGKKNNPEVPDSFSKIYCFLLSNRFSRAADLHDLFPKRLEEKSFSKKHISYVTTYNSCFDFISSSDSLSPRKPSNRSGH